MEQRILHSIEISEIDMENCYFNPGCALCVHNPDAPLKVLELLEEHFGDVKLHSICCHHDPQLPEGATIINNCAGCDRRFRTLYEGINTISIWEVLDEIEDLPLPQYEGMQISVHDSCSYRPKPNVHRAVRSLLNKMGIEVIDSEFSKSKSICCGDNLFGRVPIEEVHEFQKKRAAQMPCDDVAVYCISCVKAITIGGKKAHHMVDLLLGEETDPKELDLAKYHEAVGDYIKEH